jgi:integrase
MMSAMRARDPEFRAIHPHAFRHYFNYLLSRSIDHRNAEVESGSAPPDEYITESRELDIRAFVNGHWNKNSGAVYNRRHIQEASASAVMALQSNLIRKGGGGSRDD